ncbi:hypothetical protein GUITHDRAFT_83000 [Guillardia theta CCMP2712]|uniref:Uncharacterized protein n=1 Tax=Guillardia theta (strain CCMP2712) TaxID=905079 RepID=L1I5N4_GUITC|nr:hypothetical protein GUITHDRAFT_83000 [Guillardia theta CCMP2712]EKX31573.1 hypothetical protein GUITHDRAFT_83000 [Guillardia theta CCMP2712]|eukprot:XP_005818553.1 hypothetical protein GUITHDRAFT_83000 [Guillardia theta CCMP2712]
MGLVFGSAMDLGKVTLPLVIREQFIFRREIMLKMFLGASAGSAYCIAGASLIFPLHFERAREEFMSTLQCKGLIPIILGAFILGCGMCLSGSCPGMVLVQVGAGIPYSWLTLIGGLSGAALYGVVQPKIEPYLKAGKMKSPKIEDYGPLKKVPFWGLALALAVCMTIFIVIIEVLFPWEKEVPVGTTPWKTALPPELMGAIIGFLQIPAILLINTTLGSSSAYMTYTSQPLAICKNCQDVMKHLNGYRTGIINWWQAVYLVSAIGGAAIAANAAGTYGKFQGVTPGEAFIGGFCAIFGSRLASGCTSGHGLSGVALLSLKSMFAVPGMFGGGIVLGFIYFSVDSYHYTGRLYS